MFANAQTGNIVLFSIHLTQMEWARAAASAIPAIAFALGIIVTETVRRRQKLIGFLHWRQGMWLILEIVILAAAVFIPEGLLDSLVQCDDLFHLFAAGPTASDVCMDTASLRLCAQAICAAAPKHCITTWRPETRISGTSTAATTA